jgi:hypothetical protein
MGLTSPMRARLPNSLRPPVYLTNLARRKSGGVVVSGPFAGLRYVDRSFGGAYIPRLLGIYERELAPCIEEICRQSPRVLVNVGAAEGYYAIGFARRLPNARVLAYESSAAARAALFKMSVINSVRDRVEIHKLCTPELLADLAARHPRATFVIDVEGGEVGLLRDPTPFSKASILLELHEFVVDGVTKTITDRFENTHKVNLIWQQPRQSSEFPWKTLYTRLLPQVYRDWAVSEWRSIRMSWLWMSPRCR